MSPDLLTNLRKIYRPDPVSTTPRRPATQEQVVAQLRGDQSHRQARPSEITTVVLPDPSPEVPFNEVTITRFTQQIKAKPGDEKPPKSIAQLKFEKRHGRRRRR